MPLDSLAACRHLESLELGEPRRNSGLPLSLFGRNRAAFRLKELRLHGQINVFLPAPLQLQLQLGAEVGAFLGLLTISNIAQQQPALEHLAFDGTRCKACHLDFLAAVLRWPQLKSLTINNFHTYPGWALEQGDDGRPNVRANFAEMVAQAQAARADLEVNVDVTQ